MTDGRKRALSIGLYSIGMIAGLFGCVATPRAIFVIGVNDSMPEVWALLLPMTLLPTCVVALWWRKPASVWFLLLSLIWACGMIWQRHYMSTVRHFQGGSVGQFLVSEMLPAYFVFALAVFGLITEYAEWPQMIRRQHRDNSL